MFAAFCASLFNAQTPLSVAGRAPRARLPPLVPPAEYPPIGPWRTSPATKNPHPHARNPVFALQRINGTS